MGCDIHGCVEIKVDNEWKFVSTLKYDSRNYNVFCNLAGVRCRVGNHIARQVEPDYFIPDDVSSTTQIEYDVWDTSAHSAKTLSAKKFVDIICENQEVDLSYDESMEHWLGIDKLTMFTNKNNLDDFRVVFWFDN